MLGLEGMERWRRTGKAHDDQRKTTQPAAVTNPGTDADPRLRCLLPYSSFGWGSSDHSSQSNCWKPLIYSYMCRGVLSWLGEVGQVEEKRN
jgi:hypothetical protein